jgi:hypothetical protein
MPSSALFASALPPPHHHHTHTRCCSAGGCAPGHGGSTCEQCIPGFFSTGGKPNNPRPICKPCGLHFTSPPGAVGPAYCQCEAGYGAAHPSVPMWQHKCDVCPVGTFNPGPGVGDRHVASIDNYDNGGKQRLPRASPCRPCNATNPHGGFSTADMGATSSNQCVCAPGFGGPACDPCLEVSISMFYALPPAFSSLRHPQTFHTMWVQPMTARVCLGLFV